MTHCILDASVLIKWFKPQDEAHITEARTLLESYSSGMLEVAAPRLVLVEIINSAVRRWQWDSAAVTVLASRLDQLRFDLVEPSLMAVARWTLTGLTAYDSCYVALAEELHSFVITEDERILQLAGSSARSLTQAVSELGA